MAAVQISKACVFQSRDVRMHYCAGMLPGCETKLPNKHDISRHICTYSFTTISSTGSFFGCSRMTRFFSLLTKAKCCTVLQCMYSSEESSTSDVQLH